MRCFKWTIPIVSMLVVCSIGSTGCSSGAKNGASNKGAGAAGKVTGVTADQGYQRVADTNPGEFYNVVGVKKNAGEVVTLTITVSSGTNTSLIEWGDAATEDSSNPLKATVPIGTSITQNATVSYEGVTCRQIKVWPVWSSLAVAFSGEVSPENSATMLAENSGEWSETLGGGKSLGPVDRISHTSYRNSRCGYRIEARAVITPDQVWNTDSSIAFRMRRDIINQRFWEDGGHFNTMGVFGLVTGPFDNTGPDNSNPPSLDENPIPDGKLFDLDVPACPSRDFGFYTGETYVNFDQYVAVAIAGIDQSCSDKVHWHFNAMAKNSTTELNGDWVTIENVAASGHIANILSKTSTFPFKPD